MLAKEGTLLKCLLLQPAPVRCEGELIGTNIIWDFTREFICPEDAITGQKIIKVQKLFKSNAVTVELHGTLEGKKHTESFRMEKNSTAQDLIHGIHFGYKRMKYFEESRFQALKVIDGKIVTLSPTTEQGRRPGVRVYGTNSFK
jgi:hypothetical protein